MNVMQQQVGPLVSVYINCSKETTRATDPPRKKELEYISNNQWDTGTFKYWREALNKVTKLMIQLTPYGVFFIAATPLARWNAGRCMRRSK